MTNAFLTVSEVSKILRCSPESVRRWINDGNLAAQRLPGGYFRIRRVDLDSFLSPAEAKK
jgi:excisionase family DNA binding protein